MSQSKSTPARTPAWSIAILFTAVTGAARAGLIDDPIGYGPITVELQEYAQLPATGSSPRSRINFLREEPGGSDRLFVNDLRGELYTLDKATRATTTYLDFGGLFSHFKTSPGLASGLVTFAFDPGFASNGKLYTVHAEDANTDGETSVLTPPEGTVTQHSVLTEWTAADPAADVFAGTRREVMRLGTLGQVHPVGDLGFIDGLLHIAVGDGQSTSAGLPGNLQRADSYLGAMLRIDPDPSGQPMLSSNGAYSIPAGNPFFEDANGDQIDDDPSTFGEVYAFGFRNPHRFAYDAVTDEIIVTDIGKAEIEEVDLLTPGADYGWPVREGTFVTDGGVLPPDDATLGFTYPVAQYDHDEGDAIAGGFVYRGTAVPALQGQFVFGDIVNGRIFYADVDALRAADDGDPATTAEILELRLQEDGSDTTLLSLMREALGNPGLNRADLRLGVDDVGELYVLTKQDGLLRTFIRDDLAGDYDASGQVEQGDLDLVLQNWGFDTEFNGVPAGWVNDLPSGQIEQTELDGILQNWGDTSAPDFSGAAIPEPAAIGGWIAVLSTLVMWRRHAAMNNQVMPALRGETC